MQNIINRFESYGFIEEGMISSSHTPFLLEYANPFTGFVWQDYQEEYIYFFPGKSFHELRDVYRRIGEESETFTINEVDYIADHAFFINTDTDDRVRLIVSKDGNIF